ncbi:efflux RND transporter periplasmic adaptor subunit [Algoriphagus namhaensis]
MKKHFTHFCWILLSSVLLACGESKDPAEENPEQTESEISAQFSKSKLQLFKVNAKSKEVNELISGRVIAKNQTQLYSEVQGLILPTTLSLKAGTQFKKGDVLVSIDSEEFGLNLKSQKSAFLNALTGIMPDLKADYPDNFQAWLDYLEGINLDEPLADLPESKSKSEKFFLTSRGIYTSFFGLKAQEERLRKFTIYAPYDGVVTQSLVDEGSLVNPGQPLGTVISINDFELEAGVSLRVGAQLEIGEKVLFTSNEVAGSWTGTVKRIVGAVDPQTQNIPVYFQVSGKEIIPGMYLQGTYASASFLDVYVLPSAALGRDQAVLLLDSDVIVSKPVETVEIFQDSTLVRGLNENDLVILNQFVQPMAGKKVAL